MPFGLGKSSRYLGLVRFCTVAAPDFTLKTKNAEGLHDISLSANYGKKKTVLLFFPLAFTSVCVEEMCHVNSGLQEYADLNAAVYGISVDSPFALEKMAEADNLKFPLLSDFNKDVSQAYDVLYADLLGFILKGDLLFSIIIYLTVPSTSSSSTSLTGPAF